MRGDGKGRTADLLKGAKGRTVDLLKGAMLLHGAQMVELKHCAQQQHLRIDDCVCGKNKSPKLEVRHSLTEKDLVTYFQHYCRSEVHRQTRAPLSSSTFSLVITKQRSSLPSSHSHSDATTLFRFCKYLNFITLLDFFFPELQISCPSVIIRSICGMPAPPKLISCS